MLERGLPGNTAHIMLIKPDGSVVVQPVQDGGCRVCVSSAGGTTELLLLRSDYSPLIYMGSSSSTVASFELRLQLQRRAERTRVCACARARHTHTRFRGTERHNTGNLIVPADWPNKEMRPGPNWI